MTSEMGRYTFLIENGRVPSSEVEMLRDDEASLSLAVEIACNLSKINGPP